MSQQESEIFMSLGRLEGKMDSILSARQQEAERLAALDSRIREVEHSSSMAKGIAATIGAASGFVVALITHLIK